MKHTQRTTKLKAALLLLILSSSISGAVAQLKTNLTTALSIGDDDLLSTITTSPVSFGTVRTKLKTANADCFLITANYTSSDFPTMPVGGRKIVYAFRLNSTLIYHIGVVNIGGDLRWYVRRPTGIAGIGKSTTLDYEIFDDIGVVGDFTFVFGHHFTAIARDAAGTVEYRMAPVFFGMDSNIGTFDYHMSEFTGEDGTTGTVLREVSFFKTSYVWKMNGNALVSNLISKLNADNANIINARTTGTDSQDETPVVPLSPALITSVKLYPNPTSGRFNVEYSLKEDGPVTMNIFNLMGQNMFTKTEQQLIKGNHKVTFDGAGKLVPGIYVLKLTTSGYTESLRFTVE